MRGSEPGTTLVDPSPDGIPTASVIGCGAMGGIFAGALVKAGVAVSVIDPSESIRDAVASRGLRVTETDGSVSVHRVSAYPSPDKRTGTDFVFIFVKAVHNQAVADSITPILGPRTVVVTVQNGAGHGEVLATVVPEDRLIIGVTNEAANLLEPGHVLHYARQSTVLGPWLGGSSAAAGEVAALLTAGGLSTVVDADPLAAIWSKLVFNSAYSSVAAVTRLDVAGLGGNRLVWELCAAVVRESAGVAAGIGIIVDADEVIARANRLYQDVRVGVVPAGRASMLIDVEAKRLTEVDALNGAVIAAADRAGIPAPLNAALLAMVKGLESSWMTA